MQEIKLGKLRPAKTDTWWRFWRENTGASSLFGKQNTPEGGGDAESIDAKTNNLINVMRAAALYHCDPRGIASLVHHPNSIMLSPTILRASVCITNEISLYYKRTIQTCILPPFPLLSIPFTARHLQIILPPSSGSGAYAEGQTGVCAGGGGGAINGRVEEQPRLLSPSLHVCT